MSAKNLDSVRDQLLSGGLILDRPLEFDRFRRCRVEGEGREKRGWYKLREIHARNGDLLIVGSYGVFRGAGWTSHQIRIDTRDWSPEEREALKREHAAARRRAEKAEAEQHAQAARHASRVWARMSEQGESEYLAAKRVGAFGIRFAPDGTIAIPITCTGGVVHGLQLIRSKALAKRTGRLPKEMWPAGCKITGHLHMLGTPVGARVILVAEGYATAASLHMATGVPVAMCFFANNIGPVVEALRKRYQRSGILICADDDAWQRCDACGEPVDVRAHAETCPSCGQPHRKGNAGVHTASLAALQQQCHWIAPRFEDEAERERLYRTAGHKTSDFNDLHALQGLAAVRAQIEDRISQLGWRAEARTPAGAGSSTQGGGDGDADAPLTLVDDLDEMLKRFVVIYGSNGDVFDAKEHRVIGEKDLRRICASRELYRIFEGMRERRIARIEEVGFDPTGRDSSIQCNLWRGWPIKPKPGKIDRLLELLRHMCSEEAGPVADALHRWVLCWLAYPLQHPGAKMKTTIVVHGPQGFGKNFFFECVAKIYGRYGAVIGQDAVEDKYNDWISAKLFLIADEVVARSELYHIKNKLKSLITGDEVRVNPKHIAARSERNHCNLVFLSNEPQPQVLEEDDRRHAVIWHPPKLSKDFYREVKAEIDNGGPAALYHYLLNYPIPPDFHEGTEPPMTAAKAELIDLGRDNCVLFIQAVQDGDLPPLKAQPGLSRDWYRCYRRWCQDEGLRPANHQRFSNILLRRRGVRVVKVRYIDDVFKVVGPARVMTVGGEPDFDGSQSEAEIWGKLVRDTTERANKYAGNVGLGHPGAYDAAA